MLPAGWDLQAVTAMLYMSLHVAHFLITALPSRRSRAGNSSTLRWVFGDGVCVVLHVARNVVKLAYSVVVKLAYSVADASGRGYGRWYSNGQISHGGVFMALLYGFLSNIAVGGREAARANDALAAGAAAGTCTAGVPSRNPPIYDLIRTPYLQISKASKESCRRVG
jgi:hypothetical protein